MGKGGCKRERERELRKEPVEEWREGRREMKQSNKIRNKDDGVRKR